MNIDNETLESLAGTSLFTGMGRDEILRLLSATRFSVHSYHKGAVVAFRGDRYERLLIVTGGTLSAEITDPKGKVLKVESLSAPSIVAGGILFASGNELPVQLRAETDCTLLSLPRHTIVELCMKNASFLTAFLRDAGNRITFLAEKLYLFRFNTLRQKIAVYFNDLYGRQGTREISLPYSIETLAELFGVSRPSLSRSISEFVEEGIITRNDRNFVINDMETLQEIAFDT